MLKSNKNLHDGKIVVKLKKYEFIYQQTFSNLFSTQFEWKKATSPTKSNSNIARYMLEAFHLVV